MPASDPQLRSKVEKLVKDHKIFIWMKGTPEFPQCGFSGRAVQILQSFGKPIGAVNVLLPENDRLWDELELYTRWPTVPQIFLGGEFVGGCDLLVEMHQSGELKKKIDAIFAAPAAAKA